MCEKNYAGVSVFFTDCKGLIVADVLFTQFDLLVSDADDFSRITSSISFIIFDL